MPLKQLYCTLTAPLDPDYRLDFTWPLFSRLTHLEIFDATGLDSLHDDSYEQLPLIRTLTHLAFNWTPFLYLFPYLLDECAALRVLAMLDVNLDDSLSHGLAEALVQDIRFVEVHGGDHADWVIGAQTGIDYWSRAEDLIAKRASGAVDRNIARPPRHPSILRCTRPSCHDLRLPPDRDSRRKENLRLGRTGAEEWRTAFTEAAQLEPRPHPNKLRPAHVRAILERALLRIGAPTTHNCGEMLMSWDLVRFEGRSWEIGFYFFPPLSLPQTCTNNPTHRRTKAVVPSTLRKDC
ncbi:hypothetical protein C8R46DRAFT_1308968 [Mycena filopes]|nr:hypothetical protein C8R46DRAFT_1308968 [Mycena filopes]